jgi:phenylalanyl-tRNA synthetase alpha subunit
MVLRIICRQYTSSSNLTKQIVEKMNRDFLIQQNHPIGILATKINSLLPDFKYILPKNPIVSLQQNFDHLLIPASHPSRSKCDTYYVDKNRVLRLYILILILELTLQLIKVKFLRIVSRMLTCWLPIVSEGTKLIQLIIQFFIKWKV